MPFVRMAAAVDKLAETIQEEVVVQTGYTAYPYRYAKPFAFCTKDEMSAYMEAASLLVLQGGWGSICEAMMRNKPIVVMPRHNGTEHIHDQFQLVRKLDAMGCVIGVYDGQSMAEAVVKARSFNFQPLVKGEAASLIRNQIKQWFP